MRLTLAEPRLLRESVNIISDLVTEITLRVDKEKIEVVAIDPANVALVDFKLLSSAFAEYTVPKPYELAINLEYLKSVLKRAKPMDAVTLVLEEEANRLQVVLFGEGRRTFTVPLIHIEENEQKVPVLTFATRVELSSVRFDEAIEDMGIVSESLSFTSLPEKFLIKAESHQKDAVVEIPAGGETVVQLLQGDTLTSKYSIDYLRKISKGGKLADNVVLEFGDDYPLRVEYKLMDRLRLSFILAPRVSND